MDKNINNIISILNMKFPLITPPVGNMLMRTIMYKPPKIRYAFLVRLDSEYSSLKERDGA
jgi:hypothetical protein